MGRVVRLKSTGEELGREEAEMRLNRKDIRFSVEMVNGGSRMGAGDMTESTVLD